MNRVIFVFVDEIQFEKFELNLFYEICVGEENKRNCFNVWE